MLHLLGVGVKKNYCENLELLKIGMLFVLLSTRYLFICKIGRYVPKPAIWYVPSLLLWYAIYTMWCYVPLKLDVVGTVRE